MKFTDFLNESEVIKFPKKEDINFKELYKLIDDEMPSKAHSMERLATYYTKEDNKYYVTYEGFLEAKEDGEEFEEEYAVIFKADYKNGKFTGVERWSTDDQIKYIFGELKDHHKDLKKVD